jgi:site-specific DNA-cytosine methylase
VVTDEEPTIRMFSAFSGTGMFEEGVKAGFEEHGLHTRVVGYCEREAFLANLLLDRMENKALEEAPVFAGDIADIDWSGWFGYIDGFVAGLPCQPFSKAGLGRGIEDERWLWATLWEAVRTVGAGWLVIENVPDLATKGLYVILRDLAEAGWSAEWGCLQAKDVGAPHSRRRLFLVAVSNPSRERLQRNEQRRQRQERETRPASKLRFSLFPPGPSRRKAWRQVPELAQPYLRRVANGLAFGLDKSRSDRLRSCGNGVVAAQAAVAVAELLERLK